MWLAMAIAFAAVLSTIAKTFTIGYLSSVGFMEGSAITIAIESFRANGWLKEHEFR